MRRLVPQLTAAALLLATALPCSAWAGARPPIKPIHQMVNGRLVGAQVADLDGNGMPEIYVFAQGAGSGSYGELAAHAVTRGSDLSPIYLLELSGAMDQGYQGHDRFEVANARSATCSSWARPAGSCDPPAC